MVGRLVGRSVACFLTLVGKCFHGQVISSYEERGREEYQEKTSDGRPCKLMSLENYGISTFFNIHFQK